MATSKPEIIIDWAIKQINLPSTNSHKGQNGRLLVIGGSHIFHAASLWSAEIASKFIDLVHYSSTEENQQIFINLKSKFTNGIVIPRQTLLDYVAEDDCILIGPGMERGNISEEIIHNELSFEKIIQLENEADNTYALIRYLIHTFPEKKFVFDAAALQVMEVEWLKLLKVKSIITPHAKEFEELFKVKLVDDKHIITQVSELSKQYNTVILLKKVSDYISSNDRSAIITGI
jgi:NAD(P)H-hydrate epimerase